MLLPEIVISSGAYKQNRLQLLLTDLGLLQSLLQRNVVNCFVNIADKK